MFLFLLTAGIAAFAGILVMMFKCRRRGNTAMPENTAMPMFLTICEKCTYRNMAVSELLCVRVTTLLGCKYASILRVMSQDSKFQNCKDFYFNVLDISLALTTTQAKQHIDIALDITLVRASWRGNPILICRCLLYDCGIWCSQELCR